MLLLAITIENQEENTIPQQWAALSYAMNLLASFLPWRRSSTRASIFENKKLNRVIRFPVKLSIFNSGQQFNDCAESIKRRAYSKIGSNYEQQ